MFRNGGYLNEHEKWYYQGERIEVVPFYKYLGAYFTPKLSWTKTKDTLAMQANKAVNYILRCQKHFGFFKYYEAFKLFDAMVKPILMYSSEIWGYQRSDTIEKIQINFCKRIACLKQNVPNVFALSECGRLPLSVTYMKNCIKYWTKLVTMNRDRYPKQCYIMLRRLDESGRNTWATQIKRLLFQYGFGYAWLADEIGDTCAFLTLFSQRLSDSSYQTLRDDIDSSAKAITYKLFKSNLAPETYLSIDLPYLYKKTLSNFRCSGHNLMIEKGRHMNIDRQLRFCNYCVKQDSHIVEDEKHFLLICPLYETLRQIHFIERWKSAYICDQLFVNIMTDSNRKSIQSVARFLKHAFDLRNEELIETSI